MTVYYMPQPNGYYQPSINDNNIFRQISVEQAVNIVLRRVPGKVVKITLKQENGMWVYEVTILTLQGVLYEMDVDIFKGSIVKGDWKLAKNQSDRDLMNVKDTKELHSISPKKYKTKRYLLHKRIINLIEKTNCNPEKGHKPIAILIGGGTASGKTTIRKKVIENEVKLKSFCTTVVDFDEIKEYIPEYNVYKKMDVSQAAALVHRESRDIGKQLLNRLIKGKKNFIFEGTMARTRRYKSLVNKLKENGYEIHIYVVDVPVLVAKKRADERARKVPHKIIENTHKLVPRTFIEIKDMVDSFHIYDNQDSLTLIASNSFINSLKYAEFLKKGSFSRLQYGNVRNCNKVLLNG